MLVPPAVNAVAVPAALTTGVGPLNPRFNGTICPTKRRLTSWLAVKSNGVARVVTRLLFSSICMRKRKWLLTYWNNSGGLGLPATPGDAAGAKGVSGVGALLPAGGRMLPEVKAGADGAIKLLGTKPPVTDAPSENW